MSRVYEALRQMEKERGQEATFAFPKPVNPLTDSKAQQPELAGIGLIKLNVLPQSCLVALSEPRSFGAEKFRALATRLEHLRRQKEMRSLQVISSSIHEGKTVVAANLAITFAKCSHAKVLLLEGDLHRPKLAGMFGVGDMKGLSHWWFSENVDMKQFVSQLEEMPLCFLSAGAGHEQPSEILKSSRFVDAFNQLADCFDWIVVDSTPMLPVTDANLWSHLVDGSLLVVREGVAPVNVLKKGLESLDNLNLIGTVLNDASESDQTGYGEGYYGRRIRDPETELSENKR